VQEQSQSPPVGEFPALKAPDDASYWLDACGLVDYTLMANRLVLSYPTPGPGVTTSLAPPQVMRPLERGAAAMPPTS
jgi:hypothetical protein